MFLGLLLWVICVCRSSFVGSTKGHSSYNFLVRTIIIIERVVGKGKTVQIES